MNLHTILSWSHISKSVSHQQVSIIIATTTLEINDHDDRWNSSFPPPFEPIVVSSLFLDGLQFSRTLIHGKLGLNTCTPTDRRRTNNTPVRRFFTANDTNLSTHGNIPHCTEKLIHSSYMLPRLM